MAGGGRRRRGAHRPRSADAVPGLRPLRQQPSADPRPAHPSPRDPRDRDRRPPSSSSACPGRAPPIWSISSPPTVACGRCPCGRATSRFPTPTRRAGPRRHRPPLPTGRAGVGGDGGDAARTWRPCTPCDPTTSTRSSSCSCPTSRATSSSGWPVCPRWRDYYLAHDQTPHYAYLKTVLQILQWRRPGERWVLKSPQHLEQLGPLLATFPDATVVVTHRDPVSVVQSAATMMTYAARMNYRTPEPDYYLSYWTDRIRRLLEASLRDRHLVPADRCHDVLFHEFMADDAGHRRAHLRRGRPGHDRRGPGRRSATYLADHPRGQGGPGRLRPAGRLRRRARGGPADRSASTTTPSRVRGGGGSERRRRRATGSSTSGPGKELLTPVYDDPAHRITDFLYRSGGTTAAYMLVTEAGRVIVNTGHGLRGPPPQARLRRRVPRAHARTSSPPRPTSTTSAAWRCSASRTRVYVAQANNRACQHDDARIAALRLRTAAIWFDVSGRRAREIAAENPGVAHAPGHAGPRRHLRSPPRAVASAGSTSSSSPRPGARPSTAASSGCPSTASASSATWWARCSPTSRTSTRCAATATAWSSPTSPPSAPLRDLQPSMLVTGRHEPIVGRRAHRPGSGPTARRRRLRPPRDAGRHERRQRRLHLDAARSACPPSCASARATARWPGGCAPSGRPTWGGSRCVRRPSSTRWNR